MAPFLKSATVMLRTLMHDDIDAWYAWFNDQTVTAFMNKGVFPTTRSAQEAYFDKVLKSDTDVQLGITDMKTDTLIGIIGIHNINWVHRYGSVSIVIGDSAYWGKGVATEAVRLIVEHAFVKMNLRRLSAGMNALNKGSRACFEKNGFVLEGTRRKQFHYNDTYYDVYELGLLREEWDRNKGRSV